jgi:hypothetical protein
MKKTPAQKIREYLKRKYGRNMKEKKKESTLSNYGGALHLKDIRRVEDGKKKDEKAEDDK